MASHTRQLHTIEKELGTVDEDLRKLFAAKNSQQKAVDHLRQQLSDHRSRTQKQLDDLKRQVREQQQTI